MWVVSSGRAESEMSKWLKSREKRSEMLGGGGALIKSTSDDNLATLFADLTKEKSLEISLKMANGVISEMKRVTKMHKKTPQHASLAVIKSSDIPSMLVETGFISNKKEEQNLGQFKDQAEAGKFVLVYPNGIEARWNDCRGDSPALHDEDDVRYLERVIEDVAGSIDIDASRVFLAGASNGAHMSFRFAFEKAELVRAIANSIGNLPANPEGGACSMQPAREVPALIMHGTEDNMVPYDGQFSGCVAFVITGNCNRGVVQTARETVDFWAAHNGAVTSTEEALPDIDPDDGSTVTRETFVDAAGAPQVIWYRAVGAGHTVARTTIATDTGAAIGQNRDIEFAEEAWGFFESFE